MNDATWMLDEIDSFVLSILEEKGLRPNPDLDRYSLLRRIYFVLTSLPPAPEDIANFLGDDSPNALSKVADQLLASPNLGERWGRHCLDLA